MNNGSNDLPLDGSPDELDVLQSIGDIGPRYAEALRQIGVQTLADLARYTPESLAQELRDKAGVRVTPDRIRAKDWIGQARSMSENISSSRAQQESKQSPDGGMAGEEAPDAEPLPMGQQPPQTEISPESVSAAWHERGMFTIRFMEGIDSHGRRVWQARVYNEGGTGPEVPFDGLDSSPWVQWIFEQMNLDWEKSEDQEVVASFIAAEELTASELDSSQIDPLDGQMSDAGAVRVAFEEVDVNAWPPDPGRRLEVEARFRFQGEYARELAQERSPFLVEFYLIDLISQTSRQLGENRGQMEPEREVYDLRQSFAMPAPGQYELQTILLLPDQNTRAFRDGPAFHVVTEEPRSSV